MPSKTKASAGFRSRNLALLWAILILILCAIPGEHIPHLTFLDWLRPDKITHLVLFAVLSYLLIGAFQQSNRFLQKQPRVYAVILSITYGIVIEFIQEYVVIIHRTGQVLDAVADAIGALVGLWIFNWILKRRLAKKNF